MEHCIKINEKVVEQIINKLDEQDMVTQFEINTLDSRVGRKIVHILAERGYPHYQIVEEKCGNPEVFCAGIYNSENMSYEEAKYYLITEARKKL